MVSATTGLVLDLKQVQILHKWCLKYQGATRMFILGSYWLPADFIGFGEARQLSLGGINYWGGSGDPLEL